MRRQDIDGKQRGAVAIMVGLLTALMLFGLMGIAVDLAYLYTRKTELQNAADAAALAGARELDQTQTGISNAISQAIATFALNTNNNLVSGESISAANIRFGSCSNPSDRLPIRTPNCAFVAAGSITSDTLAIGKTFMEIDTGTRNSPAFFMPAHTRGTVTTTGTYGYAVAGRFFAHITPIGVCGISTTRYDRYSYGELLEYGFRRGMSYNVMEMGPLGSNSVPYLVNPIDTDPLDCDPNHSSTNFTIPFVCVGNSAAGLSAPGTSTNAIGNTGLSDVVLKALNSRFGLYGGGGANLGTNQCDPASAPPDSNIMQYCYRSGGGACSSQAPIASAHQDYTLDPTTPANSWNGGQQSVVLDATTKKPLYNAAPGGTGLPGLIFRSNSTTTNVGVLWSYSRAYRYDGSVSSRVGAAFTNTEVNSDAQISPYIYNNGTAMTYFGASYPATSTPYFQTGNTSLFRAPSSNGPGVTGRRVLNLLIIDCANVSGGGACGQVLPVLGIGRFFMQNLADPTGSPKKIEAEFAGLLDPVPLTTINLYR